MHWPFLAGVSDAIPPRSRYKRLISISTRPKAAKLNEMVCVLKRVLSHFPGDDDVNISRFIYIYLWLYLYFYKC